MMKKTATAEEVRERFTVSDIDKAVSKVAKTVEELLTYETSAEILGYCIETISEENSEDTSRFDKICFIARQAYLFGYIKSLRTYLEAARLNYDELFPGEISF